MSPVRELYELQQLEQETHQCRLALAGVEAKLADTQALDAARAVVEQARQRLDGIHREQRSLEMEIGELEAHLRSAEQRLYAGATTSPKELMGLQEDIRTHQRKKRQAEDRVLELMLQSDEAQKGIAAAQGALEAAERRRQGEQADLLEEKVRVSRDLTQREEQHQELASGLPPQEIAVYESLKRSKGAAVARVERGICSGCGLSLPSQEFQRARQASQLVRCGSCSRLLYVA